MMNFDNTEQIENEIIILEQEIGELEYTLSLLKAKYESLNYQLLAIDKEEF